jgi:hypothetical protein
MYSMNMKLVQYCSECTYTNRLNMTIFGRNGDEEGGENCMIWTIHEIFRATEPRNMRWVRHVEGIRKLRNAYIILVGKPEVRRPLGRPRRRWPNNIKIDRKGVRYEDVDWIHLTQDRDQLWSLVNTVTNVAFRETRRTYWLAEQPSAYALCSLLHLSTCGWV